MATLRDYRESCSNDDTVDNTLITLIRYNAIIRNDALDTYPSTASHLITNTILDEINAFLDDPDMSATDKINKILKEKPEQFSNLFSKGFERLRTLRDFLHNGVLSTVIRSAPIQKWDTFDSTSKAFMATLTIIVTQVFGDGNHRTAMKYLSAKVPKLSEHQLNDIRSGMEKIHRRTMDYPEDCDPREWFVSMTTGFYSVLKIRTKIP